MTNLWKWLSSGLIVAFIIFIVIQSVASKDVSLNEPTPFPAEM